LVIIKNIYVNDPTSLYVIGMLSEVKPYAKSVRKKLIQY